MGTSEATRRDSLKLSAVWKAQESSEREWKTILLKVANAERYERERDTGGENQCPELEHCKYTVSKWTM